MPKLNNATGLDAGLRGWLIITAQRNYWRVASYYEVDDLIADGFLIWAKCRKRYSNVTERRHFMALFKVAYTNHIIGLANKRTRITGGIQEVRLSMLAENHGGDLLDMLVGGIDSDTVLGILVRQARFPVRAVLELLTTDAGASILTAHPRHKYEQDNNYICRLIGVSPRRYDLPALVSSFLRGGGRVHEPSSALVIAG